MTRGRAVAPRRAGARRLPPAPRPSRARRGAGHRRAQRGQATLETLALIPAFVAVGLGLLQLLAVGYASVLAGGAAEAGALELARGRDPAAGARAALPGWETSGARVEVDGGRVRVHLRPPSPLRALAKRLEVTGTAAVEPP